MKPPVIVRDFAQRIGIKSHVLLAELMTMNVFANPAETIGEDIARKICERHGFLFELEKRERGAGTVHAPPKKVEPLEVGEQATDLMPRPPVSPSWLRRPWQDFAPRRDPETGRGRP